jgi:flagellar hook assembly protein FlgD
LLDEKRNAGKFFVYWDGRDNNNKKLTKGIYLGKIRMGKNKETIKLVVF